MSRRCALSIGRILTDGDVRFFLGQPDLDYSALEFGRRVGILPEKLSKEAYDYTRGDEESRPVISGFTLRGDEIHFGTPTITEWGDEDSEDGAAPSNLHIERKYLRNPFPRNLPNTVDLD